MKRKKKYFHGSESNLPIGTTLLPQPGYAERWSNTDFYLVLEKHRPADKLAHHESVFLCDNPDDIDMAGGSINYIYSVDIEGPVSKHDMNWSSQISCLISEGYDQDSDEVKQAAMNYWSGVPHEDEQVWEYLCSSCVINKMVECNVELDNDQSNNLGNF